MSIFWIDDMKDLAKLLPEVNKRMDIGTDDVYSAEESATLEITKREDSEYEVLIIRAEKSGEKDGSSWRQRVILEWNLDYQTIDEVVYDLRRLLGLTKNI